MHLNSFVACSTHEGYGNFWTIVLAETIKEISSASFLTGVTSLCTSPLHCSLQMHLDSFVACSTHEGYGNFWTIVLAETIKEIMTVTYHIRTESGFDCSPKNKLLCNICKHNFNINIRTKCIESQTIWLIPYS
eukprot:TRINITY_DN10909_c0_g1_i2.p1 TRINITY_DN10909_c0_g1~~TRINITY_DN10909_c0_g1_i2.p1  ORF type:complete len:133 (+),score=3.68 TRINITY_DN10909_c0_g1_i2:339-737(+)